MPHPSAFPPWRIGKETIMTLPLHAVVLTLVPADPPPLAEGSEVAEAALLNGLPHTLQLGGIATATLIAPTGIAIDWRDGDPAAIVSQSDETAARPDAITIRIPARLLVRRLDGTLLGVTPLLAGLPVRLPRGDAPAGPAIELTALSWDIRAGNLRGPGDFGGRIAIAWRQIDRSAPRFEPPPLHPGVRAWNGPIPVAELKRRLARQPQAVPPVESPLSEVGVVEWFREFRAAKGYAR
jgi:hypothetical protein